MYLVCVFTVSTILGSNKAGPVGMVIKIIDRFNVSIYKANKILTLTSRDVPPGRLYRQTKLIISTTPQNLLLTDIILVSSD